MRLGLLINLCVVTGSRERLFGLFVTGVRRGLDLTADQ